MPTISWDIANVTGNITVTYEGNTSQIVETRVWYGRSCSDKRRDFRLINLDNPCLCGLQVDDGEYCGNLESVFVDYELLPTSIDSTTAVYNANPQGYPDDHWDGFFVAIRIKLFDAEHPFQANNATLQDGAFVVEYGELQLTTQVSITPQTFPFSNCSGEECYGTLV